jgi:hypothetical protein
MVATTNPDTQYLITHDRVTQMVIYRQHGLYYVGRQNRSGTLRRCRRVGWVTYTAALECFRAAQRQHTTHGDAHGAS